MHFDRLLPWTVNALRPLLGTTFFLVIGCGGASPAPVVASAPPAVAEEAPKDVEAMPNLASTSCMLHESEPGRRPLPILHDGQMFAVAWTKASMGEVAIHLRDGNKGGGIVVSSKHFQVQGEIPLGEVTLHPKRELVIDGWVRVETLEADAVKDGALTFTPALPQGMTTRRPLAMSLKCNEVTLHHGSRYRTVGSPVVLKGGVKAKLYRERTKSKEPVAEWLVDDTKLARQLERSGKRVHLAIDGVEAWTDASVLARNDSIAIGVGESFNLAVPQDNVKVVARETVTCDRDVALLLPKPDGAFRVGTVRAGTPMRLGEAAQGRRTLADVPLPNESDEPIWVGKHRVYVEASAVRGCRAGE